MTGTWYIDYSATQLDGATIARTPVGPQGEHATGAIRYIDDITNPQLVRTKHITKAEYASLRAAGIAMDAMYMEVGVNDPLGGYAAGQANARRAQAGANYLGWHGKILFCCDRWFTSKGLTTITARVWQDYLDGAVSVLGRSVAGGYGFADAIDAARGHVDFAVQCGARAAVRSWVNGWQDNTTQPRVGGISTDRVLILNPFNASGGGSGGGSAPTGGLHLLDDEEITMKLQAGAYQSASFEIPAGATQIRVNCPLDYLVVHKVWLAGDNFPGGSTDFDYKWSYEAPEGFRVDRLRPWNIDRAGATMGSIIWSYATPELSADGQAHPERSGSLSFR